MKTYERDARYWEDVRMHVLTQAQAWGRGSEGRTLLAMAQGEDWQETLSLFAPAGPHIPPADCAVVIIRNILLS